MFSLLLSFKSKVRVYSYVSYESQYRKYLLYIMYFIISETGSKKMLLYSKIYVLLDSSFSFGLKGLKRDVNPHAFKISMICDFKIGVLI